MSRPCSICASPQRQQVDERLCTGVTAKAVADELHLNPDKVRRHKRVCLQPQVLSETEQLSMWADRANEAYLMSGANADVRSMCAALAAGLRTLEMSFKRKEELQQQQEARDLPADPKNWTEAEHARHQAYCDYVLRNMKLPTPEEYALCYEGETQQHEHSDLLPIR
jgi:hypothetical protein